MASGQDGTSPSLLDRIQPVIGVQIWTSYTTGAEVFDQTEARYEAVDNRINTQLRRSRLGFRASVTDDIEIVVISSADFIGRDVLAGTLGGANNGGSPSLRIWDAYVRWRFNALDQPLFLGVGYLAPQFGREATTSPFRVTSMEKAFSMNYIRRHLTGIGPGRAAGLQIGGFYLNPEQNLALQYHGGIFNPVYEALSGNTTGQAFAPLLTGRVIVMIGDPEMRRYSTAYTINHFGERRGVSVAFSGAYQGKTDLFETNTASGMDILLNWGPWNFDTEFAWLRREGVGETFKATATTAHVRLSYNIDLPNGRIIEPVIMAMQYNGAKSATKQAQASQVRMPAGSDHHLDIGVNLYLNRNKLKLSLHYTMQDGDAGAAGPGATVNNYFVQGGAGAIRRGDWLGVGAVVIL